MNNHAGETPILTSDTATVEQTPPWPRALDGRVLAQALGIPIEQNRQLRRKLHTALARLGVEWWPVRDATDPNYDKTLVELLRRSSGSRRYREALSRDHQLTSSQQRLDPSSAIAEYAKERIVKAGGFWRNGHGFPRDESWASLIERGLVAEAALLAWSYGMRLASPQRTVMDLVEKFPALRGEFDGFPGDCPGSDEQRLNAPLTVGALCNAIAGLLPIFSPSLVPTAATAAHLRDLAARLAELLFAEEAATKSRALHAARRVAAQDAADAILKMTPVPAPVLNTKSVELTDRLVALQGDPKKLQELARLAQDAAAAQTACRNAKSAFDKAFEQKQNYSTFYGDLVSASEIETKTCQAVDDALADLLGSCMREPAPEHSDADDLRRSPGMEGTDQSSGASDANGPTASDDILAPDQAPFTNPAVQVETTNPPISDATDHELSDLLACNPMERPSPSNECEDVESRLDILQKDIPTAIVAEPAEAAARHNGYNADQAPYTPDDRPPAEAGQAEITGSLELASWFEPPGKLNRLYWIVRAAEACGTPIHPILQPLPEALKAFLFGLALLQGEDDVADEMATAASAALDRAAPNLATLNLALLLPAAVTSQHIGHRLMPSLHGKLPSSLPLSGVCDAAGSVIRSGLELRAPLLEALRSQHAHKGNVEALRAAAAQWLEASRQRRALYQPATRVLQDWLADNGPIGSPMRNLIRGNLTIDMSERTADLWRDENQVRDEIEAADRRLRSHVADTTPIEGSAILALIRHAGEAATFFERASVLLGGQRKESAAPGQLRLLREATESAASTAAAQGDTTLAATLSAFALTISGSRTENVRVHVRLDLAAPLLMCPEISLDHRLEPIAPLPNPYVLKSMLDSPTAPEEAALLRAERGERRAVEDILLLLNDGHPPSRAVQDCQDACEARLDAWASAVNKRRRALERRLERNRWLDLLAPQAALEVEQRLAMTGFETGNDAPVLTAAMDEAELLLQDAELLFRGDLNERRLRLESTSDISPALLAVVDQALATGDLERADEHMRRLETGGSVTAPTTATPLPLADFEAFLGKLAPPPGGLLVQRMATLAVVNDHLQRVAGSSHKIDFAAVRPVLDAWRTAQSRSGFVREEFRTILDFLGFRTKSLQQVGNGQHFKLFAQPFDSISDCPLWQFGSGAAGRYEILGLDPLPQSTERLLRRVEEAGVAQDTPLIVICAGPMPHAFRISLLRHLARLQRRLLVLDESLLLFLATQSAPRIATFFRCALPWSGLQPYITRPGVTLPPELFVGRIEEKREIDSREGACLVYGGRQLGKTALLREIERGRRGQDDNRITLWIDLAGLGIDPDGGRPLSALWDEIGNRLGDRGIREARLGLPQLRTGVEKWLRERHGAGRILVLLDEADDFIESDSQSDFQQLRLLKGLMDQTEQGFKVVFTGLHNVQRASHQVNTPLMHLGNPICIGPLHGHAEAEEAWRLVTDPFAARGFAFDPPDLPLAILAQANYYPSLVQLICSTLIDQMHSRGRTPPYRITEDEVREVLDSRDLRRQLQDRFLRTLGLDPRYHLFALCLSYHALQSPSDNRLIEGFEPGWFGQQALEYWPEGFPDGASPMLVRTLLEEMVGLGVLAETTSGRFLLRSPNLRPLLGDRVQVDEHLAAFIGRAPPRPYPPGTFRRRLGDDAGDPRRSPLSMADEGTVFTREHGVVVISGMELAGVDRVREALARALPPQGARIWNEALPDRALNETDLRQAIQSIAKQGITGTNVLIVAGAAGWPAELPMETARLLGERKERDRLIRVVFAADSRIAWRWRQAYEARVTDTSMIRIREIALLPWTMDTLRRWTDETSAPGTRDEAERQALWDACGGFGPVLELLAGDYREHPSRFADDVRIRLTAGGREPLGDWPRSVHQAITKLAELMYDHRSHATSPPDDFDADLLAEIGEVPRQEAQRMIAWAEWMGAVSSILPGTYRLNPLVGRLLATTIA